MHKPNFFERLKATHNSPKSNKYQYLSNVWEITPRETENQSILVYHSTNQVREIGNKFRNWIFEIPSFQLKNGLDPAGQDLLLLVRHRVGKNRGHSIETCNLLSAFSNLSKRTVKRVQILILGAASSAFWVVWTVMWISLET